MEILKRKIDSCSLSLDKLILEMAQARKNGECRWQEKYPERIESALFFVNEAKNNLFMAILALNGETAPRRRKR